MRRIQAFLKCVSDAYANGKGGVAIHGGGRWVTMSAASRAPPLLPSGRNASAAISEMGSNPPQTRSLGSIFHFKLQNYMSGGGMLLVFAAGVAIGCRLDSKADNGGPPGASHWAEAQQLLSGKDLRLNLCIESVKKFS